MIASGPNPDNETYTVTFKPGEGVWTALGVHIVQEDSLPGERLARGADRVIVTEVDAEMSGREAEFRAGEREQQYRSFAGRSGDGGHRRRSENRMGNFRAAATTTTSCWRCDSRKS